MSSSSASFLYDNTPSSYYDGGSSNVLFDMGGRFYFPQTNVTVSMDGLPPAPVTWFYNAIDTIVSLLCYYVNRYCFDWRQALGFDASNSSSSSVLSTWLSRQNQIPPIASFKPHLLTFAEFQSQESGAESTTVSSLIGSWYRYAFFTSSTSLGDLTTPSALVALCLIVLLLRQIKSLILPIFGRIGRRMAFRTHGAAWVAENEIRIVKFGEYVFRLFYHSIISIYGIYSFRNEVWWKDDTIYVFRDYPHHEIAPSMAWYYLLQSAYNVDALFTLLKMSFVIRMQSIRIPNSFKNGSTSKIRRSSFPFRFPVKVEWSPDVRGDFQEMFIHHVVTNALVIGSSLLRLTRIGSMVFLIHDISDVPVDLSKLANFLKWKITTVVCFGTMALTWLFTRLYILPVKIYWTSLTQSHYVLESGAVHVLQYVCYRHFFYIFLGLLILLHAAWFLMFLRMFHTLIVKRECHDYSEHKNGEPPTTANGKKTM